jgi:uncharacterized protein with FMN-binding domain
VDSLAKPLVPARLAAVAAAAMLAAWAPVTSAEAAAAPGQPIDDDYGQSGAEVSAEVTAQVGADSSVVRLRALVAHDRRVLLTRVAAEAKARNVYVAAVHSRKRTRMLTAHKAYAAAHAATVKARAAYLTATRTLSSTTTKVAAGVRAQHYTPVDGTYAGALERYLVPTVPISFEPMQVQITVYGGHVADVAVIAQAPALSDSASYDEMSLTTLSFEAMHAGDTASIAAVSGASLTSEAFATSLQSALVLAGYRA